MLCGYPITLKSGQTVGCGQCMNCRINLKRLWTGKIVLEAAYAPKGSSFVTLTYKPECLPEGNSVVKKHFQDFYHRLRYRLGAYRYFAVGEYGDQSARPHYHAALFNLPADPQTEKAVEEAWPHGYIMVGEISPASASYVAGYTTKKMTGSADERLQGRAPEFALMSRFPPLGANGYKCFLDYYATNAGSEALRQGLFPTTFRVDGKEYPMGSYWREWLLNNLEIPEEKRHTLQPVSIDLSDAAFEVMAQQKGWTGAKYRDQYRRYREQEALRIAELQSDGAKIKAAAAAKRIARQARATAHADKAWRRRKNTAGSRTL